MKKISFARLTIKEFSEFADFMIKIGDKYQPFSAEMQIFLDSLKESSSDIELLTQQGKSNAITELIQANRSRIKQLHSAIATQIRAVERGSISSNEDALFLLKPLVNNYLSVAKNLNSQDININTNNFLLELTTSEENMSAASTLGIDLFTNELAAVKARYDIDYSARRDEYLDRRAIRQKQLRKVLKTKLQNFIKAKELAEVSDSSFDFRPLNTDLDELFSTYRANIRNRRTRRLNNAIKKESVNATLTSSVTDTFDNELV